MATPKINNSEIAMPTSIPAVVDSCSEKTSTSRAVSSEYSDISNIRLILQGTKLSDVFCTDSPVFLN